MFCSHCGTAVAINASFCHKCGKPVPSVDLESIAASTQAPVEPIPSAPKTASKSARSPLSPIKLTAPTKRQIAISISLAIILALMFGMELTLALAGEESLFVTKQVFGYLFISGLAFWYFWKRLDRRGWVGALIGVTVSLFVLFLGAAIRGYVRGQPSYILEHTPMLAALKKNYPQVYEQVREDLIAASKDKNITAQELTAKMQTKVLPVGMKALGSTSDEALLQFANVKIRQFQEVADSNANDCVSLMSGKIANADPATQSRIVAISSKETKAAFQAAFTKVLSDVDNRNNLAAVKDEKRFNALYEKLDAKLMSVYGTSAYYFRDDSLNKPADVRCKAGILLYKEMLSLPPNDRSFMLRSFFQGE